MIELTDQIGRNLNLRAIPHRIVSLVPSLTETLVEIGLGKLLIGRTKFCIHPRQEIAKIPVIGGTKNPRIESILKLNPDIIIANKEENRQEDIHTLAQSIPVYVSDIKGIDDLLIFLDDWQVLFPESSASHLKQSIEDCFQFYQPESGLRTCYMIWKDPWMTVGNDTFIHYMMGIAGFYNVFSDCERYPEIDIETLKQRKTDVVILSSEPFPFKEKHLEELRKLLPESKIILANGELFSWYGSRILKAPTYFQKLRQELMG